MNIILFGYRGCGKTTIGKMLAGQLWKTFVDTDVLVCRSFGGLSVKEIWEKQGEKAFREAEVRVTKEVLEKDEQVVALGGGTVMQAGAREAVVGANGVKVYLKCRAEELWRRIEADPQTLLTRPALGEGKEGGLEEVKRVLGERESTYEAVADHVLDVSELDAEKAVRFLIARCLR